MTTAHPATLATPQGDVGLVTPSGERFGPREGAPARVAPVGLHAPFMTNDALLALVHAFKFSGYRELAEPFGAAMAVVAPRVSGGGAPLLVSMPLSPGDRGRKRFNGVEALAAVCAGRLEWPMTAEVLRKRRDTARQSLTPHESRAANVRGAFECDPGPVERRRVILVDDLVTTGATATAAAVEILAAGAESVEVLCLARAL